MNQVKMHLLRNANQASSKCSRLMQSLKRAEEYLFSSRDVDENNNGYSNVVGKAPGSLSPSPSALPSFKKLFQEEASLLPSYLSKLQVAGHHPVMGIAKEFHGQSPCMPSILPSLQVRAMCVLLVAKSIGIPSSKATTFSCKSEEDIPHFIETRQNALSQITELLFAAHTLHRSVVNLGIDEDPSMHQGNKLAALMGDLLMAKTSKRLSQLRNHKVTEIMSDTICEFSESGFIGEGFTPTASGQIRRKKHLKTIVKESPELNYQNWLDRSRQSVGSIIGNSCVSCMIFANQGESTTSFASELGRRLGVMLQAYRDLTIFDCEDGHKLQPHEFYDLWALPVIFQAEQNQNLIPNDITQVNYEKVYHAVQSSEIALRNSKKVLGSFRDQILELLNQLKPSEPVSILSEIVNAISPKN